MSSPAKREPVNLYLSGRSICCWGPRHRRILCEPTLKKLMWKGFSRLVKAIFSPATWTRYRLLRRRAGVITAPGFRAGRSRSYINGHLATQSQLRTVGNSLVSIFGQHEHQMLLDREVHTQILDTVGGLHDLLREDGRSTRRMEAAVGSGPWRRRDGRLVELEQTAKENAEIAEELAAACLRTRVRKKSSRPREKHCGRPSGSVKRHLRLMKRSIPVRAASWKDLRM